MTLLHLTLWLSFAAAPAESPAAAPAPAPDVETNVSLAELKSTTFEKVYRLADLPAPVRETLIDALHGEPMAEPGGRWERADVIRDISLPRRRLIFAGHAGRLWLIHYEHGGIVVHTHTVVLRVQPDGSVSVDGFWIVAFRKGGDKSKARIASAERAPSAER
jgi:hypothetical protein